MQWKKKDKQNQGKKLYSITILLSYLVHIILVIRIFFPATILMMMMMMITIIIMIIIKTSCL
jgi:hypothetical protein